MAEVVLSLGACFSWLETSEGSKKLSEFILANNNSLSGYETYLQWEELESFVEAVEEGYYGLTASSCRLSPLSQRHIRSFPRLRFHLSDAKILGFDHELWASRLLGRLNRVLKNSSFVIHPDESTAVTFSRLASEIIQPHVLTIENMCPRKTSHVSLMEVGALLRSEPKLGLTFDVCHWIEAGGDYTGKELREFFAEFGTRTKALHVSVPACFKRISGYDDILHHLCARSGVSIEPLITSILGFLPSDVMLVIEGYAPPSDISFIADEIEYFGRWKDGSTAARKRAAA